VIVGLERSTEQKEVLNECRKRTVFSRWIFIVVCFVVIVSRSQNLLLFDDD
jgi:hypothetical protein